MESHNAHSGGKKCDIGPKTAYKWNDFIYFTDNYRGPTPICRIFIAECQNLC
ncbi:Uncharacterized protein dnm_026580 [Desulfonema magnum]|uniref:Uncharacterized protein n=1 Tax=Desulfonema magnum TaxID=45655 RepID=A0A975BKA7_9BACT|nr:Uncharacterized protein dnm_026580 [Desulfonema magnum]